MSAPIENYTDIPRAVGTRAILLSTAELGGRLNLSVHAAERLMSESEADGIVGRVGDGWRLTPHAEKSYGRAFRSLPLVEALDECATWKRTR